LLASIRFDVLDALDKVQIKVVSGKVNETSLGYNTNKALVALKAEKLKIFPNPAVEKANVTFASAAGQKQVTIKIMNIKGQLVTSMVKECNPGQNQTIELMVKDLNLKKGTYYLKLNNETVNLVIQ
jgi:hypothetical protein